MAGMKRRARHADDTGARPLRLNPDYKPKPGSGHRNTRKVPISLLLHVDHGPRPHLLRATKESYPDDVVNKLLERWTTVLDVE